MHRWLFSAWEPVTPRGVASFARASFARLWLVQFVVASFVAFTVVWLLFHGVFPTVRAAIQHLPDAGDIRQGQLDWRGNPAPQLLAEGRFLALSVDLRHSGDVRSPAHFQIEFGKSGYFAYSLLGYLDRKYPASWFVAFNRPELEPKWGAWEIPLLGLTALGVIVSLFLVWSILAALYALPVWLISFFANRDLRLAQCWRFSGAALMPGAIVMGASILLYEFGLLDLVSLAFVGAGHMVVGWIYLFASAPFLKRTPETMQAKNPFTNSAKNRSSTSRPE